MDTEHMMNSLIDGNLIRILDAGTDSPSVAFVVRDDESPSGFRTIFHTLEINGHPAGPRVTPLDATNGKRVLEGKWGAVADYLVESFGLTGIQARHVVEEAHSVPLLA
jgi:hypothetical protein